MAVDPQCLETVTRSGQRERQEFDDPRTIVGAVAQRIEFCLKENAQGIECRVFSSAT